MKIRQHRFAQCAVIIAMHLRVLQKMADFQLCEKLCVGEKVIMRAVNLTGSWRSCRAGDGIKKPAGVP